MNWIDIIILILLGLAVDWARRKSKYLTFNTRRTCI